VSSKTYILKPLEDEENKNTNKYQEHIVNSVGIKYNCIHEEKGEPIEVFNSADPEEVLKFTINKLEDLAKLSYENIKKYEKKYNLTDEEKQLHSSCKNCMECKVKFDKDLNKKVVHHDHLNGSYISTLCSECNLKFKYKMFLPVYAHNLKGYDSHFLIGALNSYGYINDKKDLISAIPNNEEKYISFSKDIKVDEYQARNKKTGEYETKDIMFEIRFLDRSIRTFLRNS
jgi:RNase P subunit RPR2